MGMIIKLNSRQPARSLESLNRLTGLDFQNWPESLIDHPVCCGAVLGDTAAANPDADTGQPQSPYRHLHSATSPQP